MSISLSIHKHCMFTIRNQITLLNEQNECWTGGGFWKKNIFLSSFVECERWNLSIQRIKATKITTWLFKNRKLNSHLVTVWNRIWVVPININKLSRILYFEKCMRFVFGSAVTTSLKSNAQLFVECKHLNQSCRQEKNRETGKFTLLSARLHWCTWLNYAPQCCTSHTRNASLSLSVRLHIYRTQCYTYILFPRRESAMDVWLSVVL